MEQYQLNSKNCWMVKDYQKSRGGGVKGVGSTKNSRNLVTDNQEGLILYDINKGELVKSFLGSMTLDSFYFLQGLDDGYSMILAGIGGTNIKKLDTHSDMFVKTYKEMENVNIVHISRDHKFMFVNNKHGLMRMYDIEVDKVVWEFVVDSRKYVDLMACTF